MVAAAVLDAHDVIGLRGEAPAQLTDVVVALEHGRADLPPLPR